MFSTRTCCRRLWTRTALRRFSPGAIQFREATSSRPPCCQAEVLYGIAIMAKGRKRDGLIAAANTMFAEDFRGRILPFDERAAGHFADIFATLKRRGKPIRIVDAQIAAIVRARGMIIVTRNTKDFKNCDIEILNPWSN
ncbi:MAG: PIN domain-containing protein [Rhodoplanes sp.]